VLEIALKVCEFKLLKIFCDVPKVDCTRPPNVSEIFPNKLAFAAKSGFAPELVFPGLVFAPELVFPGVVFAPEFVVPGVVFAPEFVVPGVVFAPGNVVCKRLKIAPKMFSNVLTNCPNELAFPGFVFAGVVFAGVVFARVVFTGVVFAPEFVFPVVAFAPEFVFPVVVLAPVFVLPVVAFAPEFVFAAVVFAPLFVLPVGAFVVCRFRPTKQLIIANRATIERMFLSFKNQNNSCN
jgi:hypothetical protein